MGVLKIASFLILILLSMLGLLMQFAPSTLENMGLNLGHVPTFLSEILNEENHQGELDRQICKLGRSMDVKAQLIDDLVAQRLQLLEVAAKFRPLINPHCISALRMRFPGLHDDEAICRMIILNVSSRLEYRVSHKEVVTRLEAELQHHLLNHTLLIPAAPAAAIDS